MSPPFLPTPFKRFLEKSSVVKDVLLTAASPKASDLVLERIARHLASLKGPMMKLGQIGAMVPGLFPEKARQFFNGPGPQATMPPLRVEEILSQELGDLGKEIFHGLDLSRPLGASLGQVHKGVYQEKTLAVKIQYPHIQRIIQQDLKTFEKILGIVDYFQTAFSFREGYKEMEDRMTQEVDYLQEARNLEEFYHFFSSHPQIRIPKVFKELSTSKVITMSWEEGETLETLKHQSPKDQSLKDIMGRNLFEGFLAPFFQKGKIHGDPHPMNYQFNQSGGLILMDFGYVYDFPRPFVEGVLALQKSLEDSCPRGQTMAYEQMGFTCLGDDTREALNLWARFLIRPLLTHGYGPAGEEGRSQEGLATLKKVYDHLKRSGGVRPPKDFFVFDRALVGLGSGLITLEAWGDWRTYFRQVQG